MSLSHSYLMYIGKFRREVLLRVGLPFVTTKRQAILNEFVWTAQYIQAASPTTSSLRRLEGRRRVRGEVRAEADALGKRVHSEIQGDVGCDDD